MARALTFGATHFGVSFVTVYALTGSVTVSGAITFVEPLACTLVLLGLDKVWPGQAAAAHRHDLRRS